MARPVLPGAPSAPTLTKNSLRGPLLTLPTWSAVNNPDIGPPSCLCPPGYSGVFCESSPTVEVAAYQQASPCQAAPCRHGTCFAFSPSAYACKCHPGYSGKRCEYLTTVQLAGANPYIQLDPPL